MSPVRALDLTAGYLFRLASKSGPELQANSQAGVLRTLSSGFGSEFLAELVDSFPFSRAVCCIAVITCLSRFLSG